MLDPTMTNAEGVMQRMQAINKQYWDSHKNSGSGVEGGIRAGAPPFRATTRARIDGPRLIRRLLARIGTWRAFGAAMSVVSGATSGSRSSSWRRRS